MVPSLMGWSLAVALVVAGGARGAVAADRHAIVIGANVAGQQDPGDYPPLSFADDDALRMHLILAANGFSSRLLTKIDDTATWERFRAFRDPDAPRDAPRPLPAPGNPPVYSRVLAALREVYADIRASRAARPRGGKSQLLLFFSGHGDSQALFLEDRPLRFEELRSLFTKSEDILDFEIDVVIDACLRDSTAPNQTNPWNQRELERLAVPHVNVLLASTRFRTTLEWNGIKAGVLTYVYGSALAGGAALRDARVTYGNLGAFVDAAFLRVENDAARIAPVVSPGSEPRSIIDWSDRGLAHRYVELVVPAGRGSRLRVYVGSDTAPFLETNLGPDRSEDTVLRLPALVPGGELEIEETRPPERRGGAGSATAPVAPPPRRSYRPDLHGARVQFVDLPIVGSRSKGVAESLKKGLFEHPFDEETFQRYTMWRRANETNLEMVIRERAPAPAPRPPVQAPPPFLTGTPPPPPPDYTGWKVATCSSTVVLTALGVVSNLLARDAFQTWGSARTDSEYADGQSRTRRWELTTAITFGAAGLSAAACGTLVVRSLLSPPRAGTTTASTVTAAAAGDRSPGARF